MRSLLNIRHSTLVALHNPWLSSPTGVESKRSLRAKEVVQQITARVKMNLTERQCFMGRNPDDVLPWGLFFAYRICAYHIFTGSKTDHSLAEVVKSMRETFSTIDVRWNVAGIPLSLWLYLYDKLNLIILQVFIFSYSRRRRL